MIIYKITNNTNGMVYVGQTVRTLKERIADHKLKKDRAIGKAIFEHGIDMFSFELLQEASSLDELNQLEIEWILRLNSTHPNGYNKLKGGNNRMGWTHTEETKAKMRELKIDSYLADGNPFFGKTHTDEQKMKWSHERKGRDMSKATAASLDSIRRKVINLDTGEKFISIREASSKYNIKATHITRVCRGKRNSTGGFRWAYDYT